MKIQKVAAVLAACLPSLSLAEVPRQVMQVLSPVYTIDRIYKSMEGPAATQPLVLLKDQPAQLAWVTGFRTEIVEEDGVKPSSPEFMCHINLDMDTGNHAQRFGWNKVVSSRLFTLSQAQFGVDFPAGFGMPVMTDESFNLATQVLNHNFKDPNFKVRHKVTIEYVLDKDLKGPMKPLFTTNAFVMRLLEGTDGNFGAAPGASMDHEGASCQPGVNAAAAGSISYPDAFGRKFSGHWVVKPGRQTDHTNVTKLMNVPFDTTLHFLNIHLHPFAESLTLKDLTTGKIVFKSRIKNPKDRIGLSHIESLSSKKGIPIYKDHEYDLISVYNNTTGVDQDSMATMFLYLLDKEFKKPEPLAALPTSAALPLTPAPALAPGAHPQLILRTTVGDLQAELYPEIAPQTVAQMLQLAKAGVLDNTPFYRIEPNFVVQITNAYGRTQPLTPEQSAMIRKIPAEFSGMKHQRGVLSMARENNDPNSAETSFSILLADAPHLDAQYTVFGKITRGENVLKALESVPRNALNQPQLPLNLVKTEAFDTPQQAAKAKLAGPRPLPKP